MATKKDLVEAHSFSRRRLVTAFVSGAPGGREVEPARPGRTIVGGIALAILLVAGAAVAGVFNSRVEVDWEQAGIVQDKDNGNLYVILPEAGDTGISSDEPRVRGVVNVTSARLILGPDAELQSVPTEEVADQTKGATIGIPQAPAAPATDALVQSGWTACTQADAGIKVALTGSEVTTSTSTRAYTVRVGGDYYVIAEADGVSGEARRAYSYELPKGATDELTQAIGAPALASAIEVPQGWLDLFPVGGELGAPGLGLQDVGGDVPGEGVPAQADVGDTFEVDNGLGLYTQDGPTVVTDAFAIAVLEASADDLGSKNRPVDLDDVRLEPPTYGDSSWPSALPTDPASEGDAACAVLAPRSDDVPVITLAGDPVGEASPEDVPAKRSDVFVDTGAGAVVVSAGMDSTSGDTAVLLDDRGYSYELVGSAVDNLGYGDTSLPVVPESWVELFEESIPLSRDAALCPPAVDGRDQCG